MAAVLVKRSIYNYFMSACWMYEMVTRELKQQRRRRLRKRHLKSEFALLQTLSRLFHLIYFVKCWQMLWSLILKDCIKVQEKKKNFAVLCSRPKQNVKLRNFQVR